MPTNTVSEIYDPLNKLEQMTGLISEITGETPERVRQRLQLECEHPGRNVADDFKASGGPRYEWGPHMERFYGATSAFIYELVVWNRNRLKRKLRRWVARDLAAARGGKPLEILSVGDGLGFDCLYLASKGHRVTYFELPGLSERFARRLFEKRGAAIPMLTDPGALPKDGYDAITCFDVLEHVPDPPAIVRNLAACLRPGGRLYVSAPFYMILPWYPTHLRSNTRYAGSLNMYSRAGLRLVGGTPTWYPIVLQKREAGEEEPKKTFPLIQFFGNLQRVGKNVAWPFLPAHLLRKICNRPY